MSKLSTQQQNKSRKVVAHTDNPFRTCSAINRDKRVNVGSIGTTPKTTITENMIDSRDSYDLSPNSRPKTSRGKSHPSPDEFFDYIIPSPGTVRGKKEIEIISDAQSGSKIAPEALYISVDKKKLDSNVSIKTDITEDYLLSLHGEDNEQDRKKRITLVACWLFGSALRV